MRGVILSATVATLLAASGANAQTYEQQREWCEKAASDLDLRIGSCTAVIQSGRESANALAMAFGRRGWAYINKNAIDQAFQDCNKALSLNPDDVYAINCRGTVYHIKADEDHAIADYDRALVLEPNNYTILSNRGVAYSAKGQCRRAIQDFDQALRLKPEFKPAIENRARACK